MRSIASNRSEISVGWVARGESQAEIAFLFGGGGERMSLSSLGHGILFCVSICAGSLTCMGSLGLSGVLAVLRVFSSLFRAAFSCLSAVTSALIALSSLTSSKCGSGARFSGCGGGELLGKARGQLTCCVFLRSSLFSLESSFLLLLVGGVFFCR